MLFFGAELHIIRTIIILPIIFFFNSQHALRWRLYFEEFILFSLSYVHGTEISLDDALSCMPNEISLCRGITNQLLLKMMINSSCFFYSLQWGISIWMSFPSFIFRWRVNISIGLQCDACTPATRCRTAAIASESTIKVSFNQATLKHTSDLLSERLEQTLADCHSDYFTYPYYQMVSHDASTCRNDTTLQQYSNSFLTYLVANPNCRGGREMRYLPRDEIIRKMVTVNFLQRKPLLLLGTKQRLTWFVPGNLKLAYRHWLSKPWHVLILSQTLQWLYA